MLSLITSLGSSEIHGVSTVRYIEFCFLRLAGNQIFVFTSNSDRKNAPRTIIRNHGLASSKRVSKN